MARLIEPVAEFILSSSFLLKKSFGLRPYFLLFCFSADQQSCLQQFLREATFFEVYFSLCKDYIELKTLLFSHIFRIGSEKSNVRGAVVVMRSFSVRAFFSRTMFADVPKR